MGCAHFITQPGLGGRAAMPPVRIKKVCGRGEHGRAPRRGTMRSAPLSRAQDQPYPAAERTAARSNRQDAEEAAQAVFLTLARKARHLEDHPNIAGWLHQCAWKIASVRRGAVDLRRKREEEGAAMSASGFRELGSRDYGTTSMMHRGYVMVTPGGSTSVDDPRTPSARHSIPPAAPASGAPSRRRMR